MDTRRNKSLEHSAAGSIIAWGVVSFILSLFTHKFDCSVFLAFMIGIGVYSGSRAWTLVGLLYCIVTFVAYTSIVVSAAAHGAAEVGGIVQTLGAAGLAIWMLPNMALLSQLRRKTSSPALLRSGDTKTEPGDEILLTLKTETTDDGGEEALFTRPAGSHEHFFQFSLRSLFLLAILVALACAIGTQPVELNGRSTSSWSRGSLNKTELWCVHIEVSNSDVPVMGYLWRSVGEKASGPTCFRIGNFPGDFAVNGQPVTPGRDFILFYNDADDKPQRLEISKGEAKRIFGPSGNSGRASLIEKFWKETIEPLRRTSGGKPIVRPVH
jgi:hypothetical protein